MFSGSALADLMFKSVAPFITAAFIAGAAVATIVIWLV